MSKNLTAFTHESVCVDSAFPSDLHDLHIVWRGYCDSDNHVELTIGDKTVTVRLSSLLKGIEHLANSNASANSLKDYNFRLKKEQ